MDRFLNFQKPFTVSRKKNILKTSEEYVEELKFIRLHIDYSDLWKM